RSRSTVERDAGADGPKVVQATVFQRLTLDEAVTTQDQRGMLVAGIQTQLHTASGMDLDVGADEVGIVRPGRLRTVERARKHLDKTAVMLEDWHAVDAHE